ncbi:MAG: ribbon-helix-helix protein, CopG family [Ilumatobacteraceae bacterium]
MSNNDIDIDDLFNKRSAHPRAKGTAQTETVSTKPETVTPPATTPAAANPSRGAERAKGGRPLGSRTGAAPSYEDRITRAAFYVDRDLLEQLDTKTSTLGLNKSQVVREAIATWLATH